MAFVAQSGPAGAVGKSHFYSIHRRYGGLRLVVLVAQASQPAGQPAGQPGQPPAGQAPASQASGQPARPTGFLRKILEADSYGGFLRRIPEANS